MTRAQRSTCRRGSPPEVIQGRELEMHCPELAGRVERLERPEEPTPELLLDLLGQIAVVDVFVERRAERFLQVLRQDARLRLMAGEQAEGLDVENEVVRSALRPLLGRRRQRHRVVARVDLDDRELGRVVAQPLLRTRHLRRIELAGVDQALVRPRRSAYEDRHALAPLTEHAACSMGRLIEPDMATTLSPIPGLQDGPRAGPATRRTLPSGRSVVVHRPLGFNTPPWEIEGGGRLFQVRRVRRGNSAEYESAKDTVSRPLELTEEDEAPWPFRRCSTGCSAKRAI
jgi:hypothetical protein